MLAPVPLARATGRAITTSAAIEARASAAARKESVEKASIRKAKISGARAERTMENGDRTPSSRIRMDAGTQSAPRTATLFRTRCCRGISGWARTPWPWPLRRPLFRSSRCQLAILKMISSATLLSLRRSASKTERRTRTRRPSQRIFASRSIAILRSPGLSRDWRRQTQGLLVDPRVSNGLIGPGTLRRSMETCARSASASAGSSPVQYCCRRLLAQLPSEWQLG